jgi:hypothetical protein
MTPEVDRIGNYPFSIDASILTKPLCGKNRQRSANVKELGDAHVGDIELEILPLSLARVDEPVDE